MAKVGPGRRSDVDVERLQITLATPDATLLDCIVKIGRFGRNRNEVAARIVTEWLHANLRHELAEHSALRQAIKEFDKERDEDVR